jgi:hypothetical protein
MLTNRSGKNATLEERMQDREGDGQYQRQLDARCEE